MSDKIIRSPLDQKIAADTGISLNELSAKNLGEWQLAEIRRLLAYLGNSRYYRHILKDIDPESIRTFEDFSRLPLTSEADLAGHENDFLCIGQGDVSRMVTVPTTGTTGGRKRLAFTDRDIERSLDFIRTAYTTFMHEGDRMIVMMSGGTRGSIGDVVARSMARMGVETYIYGPVTDIEDAWKFVLEWKPDVLTGIPVQMAALARYSERYGALHVREVLLSADDVPDAICDRLRRTWGSKTFRHYGMTELCIMGGCECSADMGYHVRHSDHYFEVIDPDENGYGEIAVTTFHHEAMPLLRYRTGDFGRIDRRPCGCGSRLPRLVGPRGRISNRIDFGCGSLFLRDIEEVLFADAAVIDFQCETESGTDGARLFLTLKHLSGDEPDCSGVKRILEGMTELSETDISVSAVSMECFDREYNGKKRLRVL